MNGAFDEKWFARYLEIGRFDDITYLSPGNMNEEREKFFRGEIDMPVFQYPKIEQLDIVGKKEAFQQLREDIIHGESVTAVCDAYLAKIEEKLLQLDLLKAVRLGEADAFRRATEGVYGVPHREVFIDAVMVLREDMRRVVKKGDPESVRAAERFLAKTDVLDLPVSELESTLQPRTDEGFLPEAYSAPKIRELFTVELERRGLSDWKTVTDTNIAVITIRHAEKEVRIPDTRIVSARRMAGLLPHEIGTHIMRRTNGEHSPFKLLGVGLDRYIRGEEGLAIYREMVVTGENTVGACAHLLISLAKGFGGRPYTFRELYELAYDMYFALEMVSDDRHMHASHHAWRRVYRIFRGADTRDASTCFTRDIVYREGILAIHDMIERESPERARFDVGKYDPANPRHREILDALGIE